MRERGVTKTPKSARNAKIRLNFKKSAGKSNYSVKNDGAQCKPRYESLVESNLPRRVSSQEMKLRLTESLKKQGKLRPNAP
jgi:hypothetical protein